MSQTMSQSNKSLSNEYDSITELYKSDEEESEEKMLRILGRIFHKQLLLGTLHYHNTREKMMNMINQNLIFKCTAEQILKVATDNKIEWVKGSDDTTPYEKYKEEMNQALAEILQTV